MFLIALLQAKTSLRKKKLAEKSVEKKEATLDTLQQMLDRIQNAETDQMVRGNTEIWDGKGEGDTRNYNRCYM